MDSLIQMFTHAADGVFIINEDQRIIYWNEAAQELLGYTASEVVGRACYETLKGCNDEGQPICCHHCRVARAALSGSTVPNYDLAVQAKTREIHWINVSILSVFNSGNGTAPLIAHLLRDAAQKKHNEHFIRQLLGAVKDLQKLGNPANSPLVAKTPAEVLTEREREILSLLAHGLNTRDIAQSLSISSATVRNHIQSILNKLQVHSRLEAVALAFDCGLVKEIRDVTIGPKY